MNCKVEILGTVARLTTEPTAENCFGLPVLDIDGVLYGPANRWNDNDLWRHEIRPLEPMSAEDIERAIAAGWSIKHENSRQEK